MEGILIMLFILLLVFSKIEEIKQKGIKFNLIQIGMIQNQVMI